VAHAEELGIMMKIERDVIGMALMSEANLRAVLEHLHEEDFSQETCRDAYAVLQSVGHHGWQAIEDELHRMGILEEVMEMLVESPGTALSDTIHGVISRVQHKKMLEVMARRMAQC
jgi:replicative DNA helicase